MLTVKTFSTSTPKSVAVGPGGPWPGNYDVCVRSAISRWNLRQSGWRGFEAQPWVRQLKKQYPDIEPLASSASGPTGPHLEAARHLFESAPKADRQSIQSYFVGKMALEELSCQLSGPMAGLCDKRSAYVAIWDLSKSYCRPC
jgi:hypothetical protein